MMPEDIIRGFQTDAENNLLKGSELYKLQSNVG